MFFSSSQLMVPILAGALLSLDKQVFGPFMLGRPLVTGFVLGLVTGEIGYGIWLGLSVELLWLATLPLGGQLIPNAGLAVTAAFTAWVFSGFGPAVGSYLPTAGLVVSFLTVPAWAKTFTYIDYYCRRLVICQLRGAEADLAAGRDPGFFARNFWGLIVHFGLSLLSLIVAVALNSILLQGIIRLSPEIVLLNLGFLYRLIPFMGLLGMAVFLEHKTFPFYLAGLGASLLAISAVQ